MLLAGPERPENQYQHAAGKVCQATLQMRAHSQTSRTSQSNKGRGFDADHAGHADQQQPPQDRTLTSVRLKLLQRCEST